VQKTGDMHYVYLPTSWCKKHSITAQTRLNLKEDNSGALMISLTEAKQNLRGLKLEINEEDQDIINKIIVACYINPLKSFKIKLGKEITAQKLLNQKNIIGLESVEIEKDTISCDSTVILPDPGLLLKTMVKKIKNLALIMARYYNPELINRYEEEIDRSKILIQKSIINYMTHTVPVNLKMIDLYYISLITTDLERVVDHIIKLTKKDALYLQKLVKLIEELKAIIDSMDEKFEHKTAIEFAKKAKALEGTKTYDKRRIRDLFTNISEIVLDWSITKEISK